MGCHAVPAASGASSGALFERRRGWASAEGFDAYLYILEDCNFAAVPLACGANPGPTDLEAGTWYVIVERVGGGAGPFTLMSAQVR